MERDMFKVNLLVAAVISMVAIGVGGCAVQPEGVSDESTSQQSSALLAGTTSGLADASSGAAIDLPVVAGTAAASAQTLAATGIAQWSVGHTKTSVFVYGSDPTGKVTHTLAMVPQPNGGMRLDFTTMGSSDSVLFDADGNAMSGTLSSAGRTFQAAIKGDFTVHGTVKSTTSWSVKSPLGCAAAIVAAGAACSTVVGTEGVSLPACVAATASAAVECSD